MSRIVYDSERPACPRCGREFRKCVCRNESAPRQAGDRLPDDGVVRIRREVRRGKPVTCVLGLPLADRELAMLAKAFKKKCGVGGSAKDGVIEIQGDQRDVVEGELNARGYTTKRAGG